LKIPEAIPIHGALKRIYERLIDTLKDDPPPEVRKVLWYMARAMLKRLMEGKYENETSKC